MQRPGLIAKMDKWMNPRLADRLFDKLLEHRYRCVTLRQSLFNCSHDGLRYKATKFV